MNADRYSRITSSYACPSFGYSMPWRNYPSTPIKVPYPDTCPCCNKVMANDLSPVMAINNINIGEERYEECKVVSVYRCASCNSLFAIWSEHKAIEQDETTLEDLSYTCKILAIFPFEKVTVFTQNITNLSAEFVSVFNQTEIAEAQNLNDICGMGYRRALPPKPNMGPANWPRLSKRIRVLRLPRFSKKQKRQPASRIFRR